MRKSFLHSSRIRCSISGCRNCVINPDPAFYKFSANSHKMPLVVSPDAFWIIREMSDDEDVLFKHLLIPPELTSEAVCSARVIHLVVW